MEELQLQQLQQYVRKFYCCCCSMNEYPQTSLQLLQSVFIHLYCSSSALLGSSSIQPPHSSRPRKREKNSRERSRLLPLVSLHHSSLPPPPHYSIRSSKFLSHSNPSPRSPIGFEYFPLLCQSQTIERIFLKRSIKRHFVIHIMPKRKQAKNGVICT